jgi:aryl-alcohol dehydrogenase-like predicted oxidoreductase
MEKRRFGKTGIEVSALGFGAAESGLRGAPLAIIERLLGKAHDAGVNVIDTAPCYGESEELIGRATQCWRKHFHILTKCGHAAGLDFADWTPELVEKSIERSLRRLRTDYLDVVQLHSCGEAELRRGDLVEALKRAQDKGMARYVGYSGDGRAALYAASCGAFDTLQISINLRPGGDRSRFAGRHRTRSRCHRQAPDRKRCVARSEFHSAVSACLLAALAQAWL